MDALAKPRTFQEFFLISWCFKNKAVIPSVGKNSLKTCHTTNWILPLATDKTRLIYQSSRELPAFNGCKTSDAIILLKKS